MALSGLLVLAVGFDAASASTPKRLTAKQRAGKKRALLKAVKKDGKVVLKPWFMKRAALYGVDVPVTIRLSPAIDQAGTPASLDDDSFKLSLGSDPTAPPLPVGVAAGDVTGTLKGRIGASLRFSQDASGYGSTGTIELGFSDIDLQASGFDLTSDATPATCSLLSTSSVVNISESTGSDGFVNVFNGTFAAVLRTAFSFSSQYRNTCADPFTTTAVMDGSGRPPYPLRLNGSFRISPAITADGRMRLGKFALSGTQRDSFVQVHTCTSAPPPATCALGSDSVMPGRLIATSFNAEMIIGSVT